MDSTLDASATPARPIGASAEDGAPESFEAELWKRARSLGDGKAREQLIEMHLPYARIVAASYYAKRFDDDIEFGDYLQWASVGLVESVDRYDASRGVLFRTFAARRMHGAILDGIDRLTEKRQQIAARRRVQQERLESVKLRIDAPNTECRVRPPADGAEALLAYLADVGFGIALGLLLEGTGMVDRDSLGIGSDPEQHYRHVELAQLRRRIAELVARLPEAQRRIVQAHYHGERSFTDIATDMNLTKGRISQIHKQALAALRERLADREDLNFSC